MKTVTRLLAVVMAFVMMSFVFTACEGTAEKELIGDWTISTFNGMTSEEYAAARQRPAEQLVINLKLEADKATFSSIGGSQEFQVTYTKEGVDLIQNGANAGSFIYDKAAQTLTINDVSTGPVVVCVFKKGTVDLVALRAQYDEAQAQLQDDEEFSGEGDNDGFTGRDYGELTQEELDELERYTRNDGLTGRDYGELTQEEIDEMNRDSSSANNTLISNNTNRNTNTNSTRSSASQEGNNAGFTGRDYGELTQEELDEIDRSNMNAGLTGRDYGELTQEEIDEIDRSNMNAGLTGRDYGELTQEEIDEMTR
ncbi:MAG: hypothetical protein J6Z43_05770 [Clostridiales bacterium]|nr:hypothetical protein [Clostridiales bacterium]